MRHTQIHRATYSDTGTEAGTETKLMAKETQTDIRVDIKPHITSGLALRAPHKFLRRLLYAKAHSAGQIFLRRRTADHAIQMTRLDHC